jgi:serine/threonine-protein kinase
LEERVSEEFPPAFSEFGLGSQIAGYRLEEQIGRGGMAVVYRAYDPRLDRLVALKILAPGLALDHAFRQRFIRESRAAAAVDHPNIIPVFDAGEADGVLFIAMRYARGSDVRTLLDSTGPLPPARVTEITGQVASALDAAHARGLVHRDVKPGNMLLDAASGGQHDHVYLADFGLSKQSLAQTGITSQGQFLGTLDYVAPEQIEGRPVDGRADLYALACAAFELLCGAPPFKREAGLAVAFAKLSEAPPLLSSRRTDLPAGVDEVLARAMARAPGERFGSCGEFTTALREVFQPGRGPATRPSVPRLATQAVHISEPAVPSAEAAGPAGAGPPTQAAHIPGLVSGDAAPLPGTGAPAGPGPGPPEPSVTETSPSVPDRFVTSARGPDGPANPGDTRLPGYPVPPDDRSPSDYRSSSPQQAQPDYRSSPGYSASGYSASGYRAPSGAGGSASTDPRLSRPGGYGAVIAPAPRRSWWQSRALMSTAAAVVVVGVAAGAFAALHHGSGSGNGHTSGGGGTAAIVPPVAVKPPPCTTTAAKAGALSGVRSQTVTLSGSPFGVAVTPDGKYSFVSLGNSVAVLSNGHGSPAPTPVTTIQAAGAKKGDAITRDGKYLLAAAGSGAYVINVSAAESGSSDAVLGTLTSPGGKGSVEVSVSPDDRFAFITLQNSAEMAVFNLQTSLAHGLGQSGFVGMVPLGPDPIGIAQSPDGRWLYVTGESTAGKLYVLSMSRAETDPGRALQQTAAAGCAPARVLVSPDGNDVWVTARDSNALIAFSAAKLLTKPAESLIARVNVGQTPIGLTFIKDGTQIMVADSNLKTVAGADSLALISTQRALQGQNRGALLGFIPTGHVPREVEPESGGQILLVAEDGSGQLQSIDAGSLP